MIHSGKFRGFLTGFFWDQTSHRFRSGWRLVLHTCALIGLMTGAVILLGILSGVLPISLSEISPSVLLLGGTFLQGVIITLSVIGARRWIDKRSMGSLGLSWNKKAILDCCAGFGIAFLQLSFVFLIMSALGWSKIQSYPWETRQPGEIAAILVLMLLLFILVGWYEELIARGYWFQNLKEGLNTGWALLVTSGLFAAAHGLNPGASWQSFIGLFVAGGFLGYAVIRGGTLWLPIGIHIGWNFFEGPVFGFPVSGLSNFNLVELNIRGPEIWTGGSFGPEAGLVIIPSILLGVFLVHQYSSQRFHQKDLEGIPE